MTFQSLLRLARAWFGLAPARTNADTGKIFPTQIEVPPKPIYDAITRTYNFLGALIGLLLLSPLMLTIAAAVKLTSPGPALYSGARVGKDEVPFNILKFRTMKVGSEQKIGKRLVRQDEDHYTSIGKFLRKFRLDELAQLINVLRGDMNLVGARPVRPIFLAELKRTVPGYARKFMIRPGITGQAQVRGGYYTSPRHKLFYDMLYTARRSVWMDLQLIALTFLRVMTRIFTTGFLFAWLLVMALVLPADVQARFTVNFGGANLNLLYLGPTLIALAQLLRSEVNNRRIYALRTPLDMPIAGFLIVTAILIPLSRFPFTSFRGLLWYVCNGVVVFYLVLNSRLVTDRRDTLVNSLVGIVSVVGLAAIGISVNNLVATGEFTRATGPLDGPLLLATVVAITLPLAVAAVRHARRPLRRKVLILATVVLGVTALGTLSRSGIAATAVALAVYFGPRAKMALVTVGVGFALVVGVLWTVGDPRMQPSRAVEDLQAAAQRQAAVLENLTSTRLWVGVGARALPRHTRVAQRHGTAESMAAKTAAPALENTYLTLFADHGPLGLAFFLAFFVGGIVFMFRAARTIPDAVARDDLRATAAGLIGCAILFLFSDALYRFPMMIVFWSTMGLGVGIALSYRPGPRSMYRIVHFRHQL